ncbi:MAG: hypothetical protein ACAF41_05680 [Leptolyngbya sp. BL-A-14]
MTSQLMIDSPTRVSEAQTQPQQSLEASGFDKQRARLIEAMKAQYQLDQQVKFLHLQAEADSLLQQLQSLKQQRQASEDSSPQ